MSAVIDTPWIRLMDVVKAHGWARVSIAMRELGLPEGGADTYDFVNEHPELHDDIVRIVQRVEADSATANALVKEGGLTVLRAAFPEATSVGKILAVTPAQLDAMKERHAQLRREREAAAERERVRTEQERARRAEWDSVAGAIGQAVERFVGPSGAGFAGWLDTAARDAGPLFAAGVRGYLHDLLALLKRPSHRKDASAEAVLARVIALRGDATVDPDRRLPSSVRQFDDDAFLPEGWAWGEGGLVRIAWVGELDDREARRRFAPIEVPVVRSTSRRFHRAGDGAQALAWVVSDWLPVGASATWFGASYVGKSLNLIDMLCHVALGRPWRGYATTAACVVIWATEDGESIRRRIDAWAKYHAVAPDALWRLLVVTEPLDLADPRSRQEAAEILREARAEFDGEPIGVWAVDTLSKAFDGNENGKEFQGAFDAGSAILADVNGATCGTFVAVHHSGTTDPHRERGFSGVPSSAGVRIVVGAKAGVIEALKVRDHEAALPTCRYSIEDAGNGIAVATGTGRTPAVEDADALLALLRERPNASQAEMGEALGWITTKGEPDRNRVRRVIEAGIAKGYWRKVRGRPQLLRAAG